MDYLGVAENYSFQNILSDKLYKFINIAPENCLNPRFQDNYDQVINNYGGLDLCILGIGKNGHIAFNEPETPKSSWTHCVWLSESTRQANKLYFSDNTKVATKAITMGISTILAARKIILIATGEAKIGILTKTFTDPANQSLPASFLTLHKSLLTVTDFPFSIAK